MKKVYLLLLFTVLSIACKAQTILICDGVAADGTRTYIEAYEYDYVSEKPSFPGGDSKLISFINRTREYPAQAYKARIEGRVTCSFVVNPNGSISHISIVRGVEPSLNAEAVRIVSKMPKWTPGRYNGKAVPVRVTWTIPFRR